MICSLSGDMYHIFYVFFDTLLSRETFFGERTVYWSRIVAMTAIAIPERTRNSKFLHRRR